jgi:hypothetical protein
MTILAQTILVIGAVVGFFAIAALMLLMLQLVAATERIAEIMRRSHAADLKRYDELYPGAERVEPQSLIWPRPLWWRVSS